MDWIQRAYEGDLIGDRQVQVISTQVSEIRFKWWLMTVLMEEVMTT